MSNETKIGILALVAIGLSLWGYKFIMGSNMFSSSLMLQTEYSDISELSLSNPVYLNGKQVGVVSDIYFEPNTFQTVVVELEITEDLPIPKSAKAELMSTGLIGGKGIDLLFDAPCSGANCVEEGDKLQGTVKGLIENYLGSPDDAKQYMDVATDGIGTAFDTISAKISRPGTPIYESYQEMDKILKNLTVTTNRMNRLLAASSGSIESMLKNLDSTTGTIEQNNEQISRILGSTANFTSTLEKVDFETTLAETNQTIKKLRETLETSNRAISDINEITAKINNSEGTLGKLIEDETLYLRLSAAANTADSLLADFQGRPYRYIPLKSRNRIKKYDKKDGTWDGENEEDN